jgi:type I restriction enzyme S subunit
VSELNSDSGGFTTLGELADESVDQSGPTSDFTYIDISCIDRESKAILDPKIIPLAKAPSRAKQVLKGGDVLVSMTRPNLNAVALVPDLLDGAIGSTGFHVLRSSWLHPKYLLTLVQTHDFIDAMSAVVQGALYPAVRPRDIAAYSFLFEVPKQQTRIVEKLEELLTGLDAGVAELKAAQKKLVQYRQSLLKAAVEGALTAEWRANNPPTETGAQLLERILEERRARWEAKQLAKCKEQGKALPKDWQKKYPEPVQPDTTDLPELPQGWAWASVEQLSESVRNGLSKTPNTEQRGYPIFKINAVRPMAVNFTAIKHIEINESEAADYWVEVGDVLATRYNGSIDLLGVFGMVKNVPQRTLHPDKLIRMKPLTGPELGAWMEVCGNVGLSRKHLVARVKTTAGQTGISGEDLKRTPIPLPPVAEQKIALAVLEERLKAINELELPTELGLKQSTAQRQNILKAAFSGQLVPQDPSDEPASELLERIRAERAAQQAVKKPRGRKAKEAA